MIANIMKYREKLEESSLVFEKSINFSVSSKSREDNVWEDHKKTRLYKDLALFIR